MRLTFGAHLFFFYRHRLLDFPIHTEAGLLPIEALKIGDRVFAQDPETGQSGFFEVVAVHSHLADELLTITIGDEDGDDGFPAEVMVVTPGHPIYVEGVGWVEAEDLSLGDRLRRADGGYARVLAIERAVLAEPQVVYNLTVAGIHTYFVLEVGVLVHNCPINFYPTNFYRFIPESSAERVLAGERSALFLGKENFITPSQLYAVHGSKSFKNIMLGKEKMVVLQLTTISEAFDYLANPANARLHKSVFNNLDELARIVNYDVSQYTRFGIGDGRRYLQLKFERGNLNIGFFRAVAHQSYFLNNLVTAIRRIQ